MRLLYLFRRVLQALENYPYPTGSDFAEVAAPFWQEARCPSRSLRRLSGIVTGASFRSNALMGIMLNTFLPWDALFTFQFERFRADLAAHLPAWLDAWHTIEALSSLADFADLTPTPPFPSCCRPATRPRQSLLPRRSVTPCCQTRTAFAMILPSPRWAR